MLKLGTSQADEDESVTPQLTKPSQIFQTEREGRNQDAEADSSESPLLSKASDICELETSFYFSLTLSLNKKRERCDSLPLSALPPIGVCFEYCSYKAGAFNPGCMLRITQGI